MTLRLGHKIFFATCLVALLTLLAAHLVPSLVIDSLVALVGATGSFYWLDRAHRTERVSLVERMQKRLNAESFDKLRSLGREKQLLEAILGALIESVIAIDEEGRILFLNPAAEHLFEVQSEEVKGKRFLEGLRHGPLLTIFAQMLAGGASVNEEITLHSPTEHILSIQAVPVNYDGGKRGMVAALHDVTELRKLERVRQEFVANASHELKTPLTAIKGFVETLLDGALDDPKNNRQFLETIQDHSHRLMLLLEDLLDLSAIEAKRVEYRFEPVVVSEVVERLVRGLGPTAKTKDVVLDIDLPKTLPRVRADREKLAQILMNLLDNAIKFNRKGGRVEVRAKEDGQRLQISVKDSGSGIADSDLPRVFERFFRGDKSHSSEIAGTGLGLAIVKHLVEAHQGTVEAESTLTQGSTFRFTLPIAK